MSVPPEQRTIRVLVVDDDPLAVSGIASVLAGEPDIEVVGEASSGEDAIKQTRSLRPDVVLMDLRMPGMGGIEAIKVLVNGLNPPKVISLTTIAEDAFVFRALESGSQGYLLKHQAPEELAAAVRVVMAGQSMLSPQVTKAVITRASSGSARSEIAAARQRFEVLSEREREVALLIADGLANGEIAERLFVSASTVKSEVNSILIKLDCVNRTQVAIIAAYACLEI